LDFEEQKGKNGKSKIRGKGGKIDEEKERKKMNGREQWKKVAERWMLWNLAQCIE